MERLEPRSCDSDALFRIFTACPNDIATILIDVRPHKEFKVLHISQAFCVRLSTNGKVLADYSQSSYNIKWSTACWWGKHVVVYGEARLNKSHPVIEFLASEGRCKSLRYYKDGFEAFNKAHRYLCTTSVKASNFKRYPSLILPGLLYLGDWNNATDVEGLKDIGVRSIVTVHNHPENLKPPPGVRHLRLTLPDIDTANISQHFQATYEFIEEARLKGHGVLVHCGAGVSRSATLVMMYLMRRNHWPAQRAKEEVVACRSMVCINDGFWRTLCALEGSLGITSRSGPSATSGFRGDDAPPPELSADAAGRKVEVRMLTAAEVVKRGRDTQQADHADEQQGDAKRLKAAGGSKVPMGVEVVLQVSKPEGLVGELVVGPLAFHQRCTFGRQPNCEVVLEHASISRQHAQITVDDSGAAFITDLQSAHGTKLDDTWIKPHSVKQLRPGSRMSFGASTRTYKVLSITRKPLPLPPAEDGRGAGHNGGGGGSGGRDVGPRR